MVSRDEVMAALAAIPGPDGRASLPESGAVSGVTIRDGKVFAAIAIDPARAKAMEPMRAEAEAAIRAIPGVAGAVVTLTAESARAVSGASAGHAHESKAPPVRHGRPSEPLPGVEHHRGCLGQGSRRQIDGRLQSRGRPRQARTCRWRSRRRPVRAVHAQAVRPQFQTEHSAGRQAAHSARKLRRQGDVDRLLDR